MVKTPRKKTSPGRIRPLNRPEPVQVEEDEDRRPSLIVSGGRRVRVASIVDVWEIVDEWWRPDPIVRRYYRAAVEGGTAVTVFHDLVGGAWYRQRV